jgi:uncharacterized protein (DUF952 family)
MLKPPLCLEAAARFLDKNCAADIGSRNFGRVVVATIYKICEQALWQAAETAGEFRGSAVDERDGFIHFSTASQLAETALKHFAGQSGLVLIAIDAEALGGKLKWEPSRGGDLFPHLYSALPPATVRWATPLPDEIEGCRPLPELEP